MCPVINSFMESCKKLKRVWSSSPVMSRLYWCGPAVCGGRSPSPGPKLWPWSRRHRWPPAAHRTGRSALPPHGPWGRVNTDLSQCPRRVAWRHENHWPPWEKQTQQSKRQWVAKLTLRRRLFMLCFTFNKVILYFVILYSAVYPTSLFTHSYLDSYTNK